MSTRSLPTSFRYVAYALLVLALSYTIWHFTRPQPPQVPLLKVERGLVEATVSNTRAGSVKACRRAKLAPPAGGQIAHATGEKRPARQSRSDPAGIVEQRSASPAISLAEHELGTAQTQPNRHVCRPSWPIRKPTRSPTCRPRFHLDEAFEHRATAAKVARDGCDAARSQIAQSRSRIAAAQAGLGSHGVACSVCRHRCRHQR